MDFNQAQQDMDYAYFGGATGALVSGIVWCIAAGVAMVSTPFSSMLTLFFGGMVIFPLSMLLSKLLKRPGNHSPDNPLGKLAIETTFILFVGLFLAFVVANVQPDWFYPIMLMIIGVRYLMFQSLYNRKVYWVFGAVLMVAGAVCMAMNAPFALSAAIGGVTEVIFAGLIFYQAAGAAKHAG